MPEVTLYDWCSWYRQEYLTKFFLSLLPAPVGGSYRAIRDKQEDFALTGLTLSLLMSYIYGAPSKANKFNVVCVCVYVYIYIWTRFLLGILLLEPCISLMYACKPTYTPIIHSVY
jgi:hypothetical protein